MDVANLMGIFLTVKELSECAKKKWLENQGFNVILPGLVYEYQ